MWYLFYLHHLKGLNPTNLKKIHVGKTVRKSKIDSVTLDKTRPFKALLSEKKVKTCFGSLVLLCKQ